MEQTEPESAVAPGVLRPTERCREGNLDFIEMAQYRQNGFSGIAKSQEKWITPPQRHCCGERVVFCQ